MCVCVCVCVCVCLCVYVQMCFKEHRLGVKIYSVSSTRTFFVRFLNLAKDQNCGPIVAFFITVFHFAQH
jgi:hypothetical protein